MFAILDRSDAPEVYATKALCSKPWRCDYFDHCMAAKPDDWVGLLYKIHPNRLAALRAQGIESILDIPADFELPDKQAIALDCLASGEIWVSDNLKQALKAFGPPAYYMDFETMAPGIPAYPGTRPYETVPCQFSVHYLDEDGVLSHAAPWTAPIFPWWFTTRALSSACSMRFGRCFLISPKRSAPS
ncbi:MAG: DUF2779 domain-containing protein [Gammaproteobacteria bacterium]|nr:DUF2779 domain-containing protein [Gammaproteobacteria bacterium]